MAQQGPIAGGSVGGGQGQGAKPNMTSGSVPQGGGMQGMGTGQQPKPNTTPGSVPQSFARPEGQQMAPLNPYGNGMNNAIMNPPSQSMPQQPQNNMVSMGNQLRQAMPNRTF